MLFPLLPNPFFQKRGEAIPISDEEDEITNFTNPEDEKKFDEGFLTLSTEERRKIIKVWRKKVGAQTFRPDFEAPEIEMARARKMILDALVSQHKAAPSAPRGSSSTPPEKRRRLNKGELISDSGGREE